MNNILQDLSPARVAQALDANKIAFGTLLSMLPRAVLHEEPGLLWFETGVPDSLFSRRESGTTPEGPDRQTGTPCLHALTRI